MSPVPEEQPAAEKASTSNPNSPVFWTAYADPKATKPIILLGYEDIVGKGSDNDFNDGIIAIDVGAENFRAIFSSANLGTALTTLGPRAVAEILPWAVAGVIGIALVNLVVSFSLALYVALQSRRVGSAQILRLGMVLLRRLAQNPLAFVSPPRDKPAD